MTDTKRALLLGGTGAMGVYLVPILLERGFLVDVTSRKSYPSRKGVTYITGNAHDSDFLSSILITGKYDVVIDFMTYSTEEFMSKLDVLLKSTKQYIFLSSYRVFADVKEITEKSPRLLDTIDDGAYLSTDEYALAKARQEDLLRESKYRNWTIVRPGITYSKKRFQLGTLEADTVVWRAINNKQIVLPQELLNRTTTMTWAGDVAEMIAGLVLNKKAYGDDFNVTTNEHHTWQEVCEIYRKALGLKLKIVSVEDYLQVTQNEYQLKYDRLFNRKIDNSKIVAAVGKDSFKTLEDGLNQELRSFLKKPEFSLIDYALQARIDRLTHESTNPNMMSKAELRSYLKNRYPKGAAFAKVPKRAASKIQSAVRLRTRIYSLSESMKDRAGVYNSRRSLRRMRRITSRPDGAIATLIDYSNYGNIIQRYALQEFLYKHKLNFVSYEHGLPIDSKLIDIKHQNIAEFVEQYIARQDVKKTDAFSAYITGSDQVWRNWSYKDAVRQLGFFFLDFVQSNNARRVAYAASFGKNTLADAGITKELSKYIKPHIDKFTSISMREKLGAKIIKDEWDRDSVVVLDPTLLLVAKEYDKIIRYSTDRATPTKDIFVYVLGPTEENARLIERIATSMDASVELINPYHAEALASVAMWLKSIRDAKLVITDSFHSTAFAIINNTPFIVIENEFGGIGRVEDLLKLVGISTDRIIRRHTENDYSLVKSRPIDWKKVNRELASLRKQSGNWLLSALKK